MHEGTSRRRSRRLAALALCAAAALSLSAADALAQGWGWWPWSQPEPRPREPVYRPPIGGQMPPGQPPPGQQQLPPQGQVPSYGGQRMSNLCLQLEQRLVAETQGSGNQARDLLPKIEGDMRQLERQHQTAQLQLNRADCWDQFLFSRTLRRTQRCIQLANEADSARQRLADLEAQRRQIMGSGERRSYQDDIIRELARNNCGPQYHQEARRRDSARNPFSTLWGEESDGPRGAPNQFGNLPFATYRTLCVRLCDGYYFPVSFSTLPNHFQRDSDLCQSQCAAPAELFYHQNPGGSVEQMVSAANQQPYTSIKGAWRYRKEFVQGCSCKAAEYQPQQPGTDKKAEAPAAPPGAAARVKAQ